MSVLIIILTFWVNRTTTAFQYANVQFSKPLFNIFNFSPFQTSFRCNKENDRIDYVAEEIFVYTVLVYS